MKFINNIIEPDILYLVWQAGISTPGERTNRIVGELIRNNDIVNLRYCVERDSFKEAYYKYSFQGYMPYDIRKEPHLDVMEVFSRRLVSKKRSDYVKYLESIRINSNIAMSDFSLLGYSEGRVDGDRFSIINPFTNIRKNVQFLTKVVGVNYVFNKRSPIYIDDIVILKKEKENAFDKNALAIIYNGEKIGYINRILAPQLNMWLDEAKVQATIEKVIKTDESIKIYLYIDINYNI